MQKEPISKTSNLVTMGLDVLLVLGGLKAGAKRSEVMQTEPISKTWNRVIMGLDVLLVLAGLAIFFGFDFLVAMGSKNRDLTLFFASRFHEPNTQTMAGLFAIGVASRWCLYRAKKSLLGQSERTALGLAAWSGNANEVSRLMLTEDPKQRDGSGYTALMHAAKKGHGECVALLLDGGDPWAQRTSSKECALTMAVESGNEPCVRLLAQAWSERHPASSTPPSLMSHWDSEDPKQQDQAAFCKALTDCPAAVGWLLEAGLRPSTGPKGGDNAHGGSGKRDSECGASFGRLLPADSVG